MQCAFSFLKMFVHRVIWKVISKIITDLHICIVLNIDYNGIYLCIWLNMAITYVWEWQYISIVVSHYKFTYIRGRITIWNWHISIYSKYLLQVPRRYFSQQIFSFCLLAVQQIVSFFFLIYPRVNFLTCVLDFWEAPSACTDWMFWASPNLTPGVETYDL